MKRITEETKDLIYAWLIVITMVTYITLASIILGQIKRNAQEINNTSDNNNISNNNTVYNIQIPVYKNPIPT